MPDFTTDSCRDDATLKTGCNVNRQYSNGLDALHKDSAASKLYYYWVLLEPYEHVPSSSRAVKSFELALIFPIQYSKPYSERHHVSTHPKPSHPSASAIHLHMVASATSVPSCQSSAQLPSCQVAHSKGKSSSVSALVRSCIIMH